MWSFPDKHLAMLLLCWKSFLDPPHWLEYKVVNAYMAHKGLHGLATVGSWTRAHCTSTTSHTKGLSSFLKSPCCHLWAFPLVFSELSVHPYTWTPYLTNPYIFFRFGLICHFFWKPLLILPSRILPWPYKSGLCSLPCGPRVFWTPLAYYPSNYVVVT